MATALRQLLTIAIRLLVVMLPTATNSEETTSGITLGKKSGFIRPQDETETASSSMFPCYHEEPAPSPPVQSIATRSKVKSTARCTADVNSETVLPPAVSEEQRANAVSSPSDSAHVSARISQARSSKAIVVEKGKFYAIVKEKNSLDIHIRFHESLTAKASCHWHKMAGCYAVNRQQILAILNNFKDSITINNQMCATEHDPRLGTVCEFSTHKHCINIKDVEFFIGSRKKTSDVAEKFCRYWNVRPVADHANPVLIEDPSGLIVEQPEPALVPDSKVPPPADKSAVDDDAKRPSAPCAADIQASRNPSSSNRAELNDSFPIFPSEVKNGIRDASQLKEPCSESTSAGVQPLEPNLTHLPTPLDMENFAMLFERWQEFASRLRKVEEKANNSEIEIKGLRAMLVELTTKLTRITSQHDTQLKKLEMELEKLKGERGQDQERSKDFDSERKGNVERRLDALREETRQNMREISQGVSQGFARLEQLLLGLRGAGAIAEQGVPQGPDVRGEGEASGADNCSGTDDQKEEEAGGLAARMLEETLEESQPPSQHESLPAEMPNDVAPLPEWVYDIMHKTIIDHQIPRGYSEQMVRDFRAEVCKMYPSCLKSTAVHSSFSASASADSEQTDGGDNDGKEKEMQIIEENKGKPEEPEELTMIDQVSDNFAKVSNEEMGKIGDDPEVSCQDAVLPLHSSRPSSKRSNAMDDGGIAASLSSCAAGDSRDQKKPKLMQRAGEEESGSSDPRRRTRSQSKESAAEARKDWDRDAVVQSGSQEGSGEASDSMEGDLSDQRSPVKSTRWRRGMFAVKFTAEFLEQLQEEKMIIHYFLQYYGKERTMSRGAQRFQMYSFAQELNELWENKRKRQIQPSDLVESIQGCSYVGSWHVMNSRWQWFLARRSGDIKNNVLLLKDFIDQERGKEIAIDLQEAQSRFERAKRRNIRYHCFDLFPDDAVDKLKKHTRDIKEFLKNKEIRLHHAYVEVV